MSRIAARFTLGIACFATVAALAAEPRAYPTKPIRIIDAFPPGGTADVIARIMAPHLQQLLGQPIIVENHPGAGGNIGAEVAAKAAPDGYTAFMGVSAVLAPSRSLYPKLPYDALKDFAPVSRTATGAYLLASHPSLPVKTVKELVALAKARPGQLKYASGGVGSGQHLCGELFKTFTGTELTHVAYKGGPPAVAAVVSGESEIGFMSVTSALGMVQAGKLKPIAVTSVQRLALLPNVPTIDESGYKGYEVAPMYGLYLPAGAPKEIITRLNGVVRSVIGMPDVREKLAAQALTPHTSTPEELGALLAAEIAQWDKVIKARNIHVD